MTALTTIRQQLQDTLQTAFGFPFVSGRFEGPSEDRDLGCAWAQGKREADPVSDEDVFLGVRVFKQWKPREGVTDLPNADDLESFCDLVQDTLAQHATGFGLWLVRVVELEILWEQSAIEATIVGRQANRGGY